MPTPLATDLYQLTMMAGYQHAGLTGRSTFELFVRNLPPGRGYLVAAGIEQALDLLEALRFTRDEIRYLRTVPALASAPEAFFADLLPSFRFSGEVWAVAEGEVVFPHEPILRVTAPARRGAAGRDGAARHDHLPDEHREQGRPRSCTRRRAAASSSSAAAARTASTRRSTRRVRRTSPAAPRRRTSRPATGSASRCRAPWRTRG